LLVPMMLALANAPIFGWAKPVPVVTARLNHPRRDMALVALAGPGTNLVLAAIAALALVIWAVSGAGSSLTGVGQFVTDNLRNFLRINVFLAIFNLLPVPPFDGGHVVEAILPRPLAAQYSKLSRFGFPVMLFLLVILPTIAPRANIVARVVGPIADHVEDLLLGLFLWSASV
jgi:Zn-dependent protease